MEGQSLRLPVANRWWWPPDANGAAMEGQSLRLPVFGITDEDAAHPLWPQWRGSR